MPCFTEKEGIYVNLEGRAQISRQIKMPISTVEHSWEFFNKLLTEIGIEREYNSLQDLRSLMFNQYPNLMKINECKSEKMFKVRSVKRSFSKNDILLFGKESSGVPQEIHNRVSERLKIPMIKTARSLNIVSAVSISVSEAIRQNYHH